MDKLIEEMAESNGIDPNLLKELISLEQEKVHLQKRRNAGKEILEIIDNYIGEE